MPVKLLLQLFRTQSHAVWQLVCALINGLRHGHLAFTLKTAGRVTREATESFRRRLRDELERGNVDRLPGYEKSARLTRGLHTLLSEKTGFSYSVLIPVFRPNPNHFRRALESAFAQTAPKFEILLGYDGPQDEAVLAVVRQLRAQHPNSNVHVREIHCDRASGGGISRTTNELAKEARGDFLLLMDHDDWIRFDLLYRYEQVLSAMEDPQGAILYCNEFKINERGDILPLSRLRKPDQPPFPYLFINTICHCLLVPKILWKKVGGLRTETDGAQDFDLCLRLDLAGARFQNVPVFLYAWRVHAGSTALSASVKDYVTPAGIRALTDYVRARGLNWRIEPGLAPTSYRALPAHPLPVPRIHVVIPYKDQKEITLQCIISVLAQEGVEVRVTTIDNQSQDPSIAKELAALGVETLRADYPFNYSRINNDAVRTSVQGRDCSLVLFLNNDVILDPGAISELAFWGQQPGIGAVGARLRYPSGLLQHGGIEISDAESGERIAWTHTDHGQAADALAFAKIPRVVDAVTAACALVSKAAFASVGGFDEDLYPVAYSDTDLCRRLRRAGFYSFYTPFATGEHHESLSRGVNPYEDLESSRWLHVHARDRGVRKSVKFLSNHRLEH